MKILQYLIICIVIFLAVPFGVLLSTITKEELKAGRKAFKAIIITSLIIIIITFFLKLNPDARIFIIASMLFILILASTSLKISYKKKKR